MYVIHDFIKKNVIEIKEKNRRNVSEKRYGQNDKELCTEKKKKENILT
jgi:pyruvate formate-lyase activating enzyme-like uncharacterized protein